MVRAVVIMVEELIAVVMLMMVVVMVMTTFRIVPFSLCICGSDGAADDDEGGGEGYDDGCRRRDGCGDGSVGLNGDDGAMVLDAMVLGIVIFVCLFVCFCSRNKKQLKGVTKK